MRKQPEVTERTKAALRDAFWELYAGDGAAPGLAPERISVRAITERAGYNRATFYLYYRDVYDLLGQIEDEVLADARDVIARLLASEGDLDFSTHMGAIAECAARSSRYFGKLMGETGDPAFVGRLKQLVRPLVERYFVEGRGLSDAEAGLVCEFYLAGIMAIVSRWLTNCPEMPISQLIGLIVRSVL